MLEDNSEPELPLPTDAERAAVMGLTLEQFKALTHPFQDEAEAFRAADAPYAAKRAAELAAKRARSPTAILTALPARTSHLFDQYATCSQLSTAIATVSRRTSKRFTSAVERSLVDGEILGVRVTCIVAPTGS